MKYNGTIYRPPLEADTFLLPITEGCSHNRCTFCNMYRQIPFRMLPLDEVEAYLIEATQTAGESLAQTKRVYLVGADPFVLSASNLLKRIALIKTYLPKVSEITMYARIDNVRIKSDEDLCALKEAGVCDLYLGIESGLDDVLQNMNKGYLTDEIIRQCKRLNRAGIRHSDLLMFGTAGKGRAIEAALAAAELEHNTLPHQILLNTLSSFEGTRLNQDIQTGRFVLASEQEILQEHYALLNALELPGTYFWAAHPMNAVRVEGILPYDKQEMLDDLQFAMDTLGDFDYKRRDIKGTL